MRLLCMFSLIVSLLLSVAAIPAAESPAAVSLPDDASELDPVSSGCLSCHDDSSGAHARFCLLMQKSKGCGGHIVSASYAEMATRNRELRPESSLPPELVLYEEKITCATCHGSDPHNSQKLAIDNRGSALCRACHQK